MAEGKSLLYLNTIGLDSNKTGEIVSPLPDKNYERSLMGIDSRLFSRHVDRRKGRKDKLAFSKKDFEITTIVLRLLG